MRGEGRLDPQVALLHHRFPADFLRDGLVHQGKVVAKIGAGENLGRSDCCRGGAGFTVTVVLRFIGELVALGFATAASQTIRAEERPMLGDVS